MNAEERKAVFVALKRLKGDVSPAQTERFLSKLERISNGGAVCDWMFWRAAGSSGLIKHK